MKPSRILVLAAATAGAGMLGMSVQGVASLDSDLQAAAVANDQHREAEEVERGIVLREIDCPRRHRAPTPSASF